MFPCQCSALKSQRRDLVSLQFFIAGIHPPHHPALNRLQLQSCMKEFTISVPHRDCYQSWISVEEVPWSPFERMPWQNQSSSNRAQPSTHLCCAYSFYLAAAQIFPSFHHTHKRTSPSNCQHGVYKLYPWPHSLAWREVAKKKKKPNKPN